VRSAHFRVPSRHIGNFAESRHGRPAWSGADRRLIRAVAPPARESIAPSLHLARPRSIDVDLAQLLIDLTSRDAIGLHAPGSRSTRISRLTPPERLTARHGYGEQPLGDGIVHEPGELFLTHAAGTDCVVNDRTAVDVDSAHLRFWMPWGRSTHARDGVAHIARCAIHGSSDLKFDDRCATLRFARR